jgi:hypothetical protein
MERMEWDVDRESVTAMGLISACISGDEPAAISLARSLPVEEAQGTCMFLAQILAGRLIDDFKGDRSRTLEAHLNAAMEMIQGEGEPE